MPLVYDDSVDNVQNQPGTVLAVTASSTSSVYVTGNLSITSTPGGPTWVTSSVASPVYIQVTGALPVAAHAVTQGGAFSVFTSGTMGVTQSGAFGVVVSGVLGATAVTVTSTLTAPVYVAFTGNLPTGTFPTVTVNAHAVTQGGAWAGTVSGVLGATAVTVTSTLTAPVYVAFTGALPTGTFPTVTVTFTGALPGTTVVSQSNTQLVSQFSAWGTAVSGVIGVTNSGALVALVSGSTSGSSGTLLALTQALNVAAGVYGWSSDLLGWRTVRAEGTDADGEAVIVASAQTAGVLSTEAYPKMFNGTTWDRVRGTTAGGLAVSQSNTPAGTQIVSQSNDQRVIPGGAWSVQVSSTTGAPVYVATTGALFVSQSNTPAGTQVVIITSSITPTVTTQALSLTGVALKAANTSRRGLTIYNQTTQVLYVAMGTTATLASFTLIMDVSGYYEAPYGYNGAYWGLHPVAGTGLVYVTEVV